MKKLLAAVVTLLTISAAAPVFAADNVQGKARESKQAQKKMMPGELFAETKRYLADKASKTAEIIKSNASRLKDRVSSEPPPAPKSVKAAQKKAAKGAKGQPPQPPQ